VILNSEFGPTQKKAAELARLIPQLIPIGSSDDDEWNQLQKAVNVCIDLLPDSMATVKGKYRQWLKGIPTVDRPKTVLSAMDHYALYATNPNLSLLLQLLATIPVTTAEAFRLFYKLERTCTDSNTKRNE